MALLAHLLQVFSGFIGPLVIFLVKQDSKFVKYHALQSLIWQATYLILGIGAMAVFFFMMFTSIAHTPPGVPHQPGQPPPAFVFFFPLIWLFWGGGWVVNLILGIVYGVKANRGEWAGYPTDWEDPAPRVQSGSALASFRATNLISTATTPQTFDS